jgi:hypothetical protein
MILEAPTADKRRGVTVSQWLYREYLSAKGNRSRVQMQAARRGLVSICKQACGTLRPHWVLPEPDGRPHWKAYVHARFVNDAWHDRRDFAESFVNGELKRGMTEVEARHIGRRCKLRLIDEIRRQTGFNKVREQRDQAFLKALDTVRHLPGDKLWTHLKNNCKTRRDAANTTIAKDWYRSEGWIRKMRKRLAIRLWALAENDEQRQALQVLRLKPRERKYLNRGLTVGQL